MAHMRYPCESHIERIEALEKAEEELMDRVYDNDYELTDDMIDEIVGEASYSILRSFLSAALGQEATPITESEYEEFREMAIEKVYSHLRKDAELRAKLDA